MHGDNLCISRGKLACLEEAIHFALTSGSDLGNGGPWHILLHSFKHHKSNQISYTNYNSFHFNLTLRKINLSRECHVHQSDDS